MSEQSYPVSIALIYIIIKGYSVEMIRNICNATKFTIDFIFNYRNIKLILPCVQYQLQYCGYNRSTSNRMFTTISNEIEEGYSSSKYVNLISVDLSEQSNETLPFAPQLPIAKCPNATFAYVAFFILLALVIVSLGALVSLKVRSLNLPCLQKRNALVENDGNTVEL